MLCPVVLRNAFKLALRRKCDIWEEIEVLAPPPGGAEERLGWTKFWTMGQGKAPKQQMTPVQTMQSPHKRYLQPSCQHWQFWGQPVASQEMHGSKMHSSQRIIVKSREADQGLPNFDMMLPTYQSNYHVSSNVI